MFKLTVENQKQDNLVLTQDESNYQVIHIGGLNPPNAILRLSEVAGMDGTMFGSSKLADREIVITVKINGDVEANRLKLYRFFKTKHYCKLLYKNGARDVYIEGWVESIETDLFAQSQTMQIAVRCPDPYFKAMNEIISDISKVLGLFAFPFSFGANGIVADTLTDDAIEFSMYDDERVVNIVNSGESDVGFTITLTAIGDVVNPTIHNVETKERFSLNFSLVEGDVVTINTRMGEKSVTLLRDGIRTNLINKVGRDSTWLMLSIGDNQFTFDTDSGSEMLQIHFSHRTIYEAV